MIAWRQLILRNREVFHCMRHATGARKDGGQLQVAAARYKSSSEPQKPPDMSKEFTRDEPYKFSTSPASEHSSLDTFVPVREAAPGYQRRILAISMLVFLAYFIFLREENDFDARMSEGNPYVEQMAIRNAAQHNAVRQMIRKEREKDEMRREEEKKK